MTRYQLEALGHTAQKKENHRQPKTELSCIVVCHDNDGTVMTLDWSNRKLSRHDMFSLRNAIFVAFALDAPSLKLLQQINLSNSQLNDETVAPLVETLGQWTYRHSYRDNKRRLLQLREVDLSHNQISSHGAEKILDMVFLIPSIQYVHLDGTPCVLNVSDGEEKNVLSMMEDILSLRRSSTPTRMKRTTKQREDSILNEEGADDAETQKRPNSFDQPVARFVEYMDELNLSGLEVGDAGLNLLFLGISNSRTIAHKLILSGNSITAVGARVIANFFQLEHEKASHIKTMQLDYNRLGPEGVSILAKSSNLISSLSSLYVARNHCGDVGAIAVAEAISGNGYPRLSTLSLLGNEISSIGVRELAKVYLRKQVGQADTLARKISSLRTLHLGDNPQVRDEGATTLSEAVRDYRVVVERAYRGASTGNGIFSEQEKRELQHSLEVTVRGCDECGYLSLWRCNVTDAGACALLGATESLLSWRKRNTSLAMAAAKSPSTVPLTEIVELDLEWNPISSKAHERLQELQRHIQSIQDQREA